MNSVRLRVVLTRTSSSTSRTFASNNPILSKASKARDAARKLKPPPPPSSSPRITTPAPTSSSALKTITSTRRGPRRWEVLQELATERASKEEVEVPVVDRESKDEIAKRWKEESDAAPEVVNPPPEPVSSIRDAQPAIPTPSERLKSRATHLASFEEPETIYTASPPKNTALLLTATFVLSVFCLNSADLARVGWTSWDEETDTYQLAPKAQRYVFAGGFATVGIAILTWGALWPARIVTKISIRRPIGSTTLFPKGSLVEIHTPITRLPLLSPRLVPLEKLHLLGPLSRTAKAWHPKLYDPPAKKAPKGQVGKVLHLLKDTFIATPKASSLKPKSPWSGAQRSHAPLVVDGDRANYTLARIGKVGEANPPTCVDWEAFEKVLLGKPVQ